MRQVVKYMLEKQRRLSTFLFASSLLLVGLVATPDSTKYSSFATAIAAMASILIGSHAYSSAQGSNQEGQH